MPLKVRTVSQHPVQLFKACLLREHHGADPKNVPELKESDTFRVVGVPSGAARFLIEVFHGLGDGVVDDEADVRLVDAHAKSNGGHHRLILTTEPAAVHATPIQIKNS